MRYATELGACLGVGVVGMGGIPHMPPPWGNSSARKRFIFCPGWMISQRMAIFIYGTVHVCIFKIIAIKDDAA